MRRALAQLLLFLLVLLLASNARAQSGIPDGVFVRESSGTTWLVLKGQRVGVPIWKAGDADIAAIPVSDQWAVLSVNDPGAMVGGSRPAWLDAQEAAPAAGWPAPGGKSAPAPTSNTGAPLGVELVFLRINPDQRGYRSVATVVNRSGGTLAGVRLRYDALDGAEVVLGSETETLPTLADGAVFYHAVGGRARTDDARIQTVRLTVESAGRVPTARDAALQPFAVGDIKLAKYESSYERNRNAYRVQATITNGGPDIGRFETAIAYVLFDDSGKIVGASRATYVESAPETISTGMALRVDSGGIDVDAPPIRIEVQAYRK